MSEMTLSATRLCKLQYSTARAMMMPPMNISIVSLKYAMQVLSVLSIPSSGKATIGIIDVMGSGIASVTQYNDMTRTTYMHLYSCK